MWGGDSVAKSRNYTPPKIHILVIPDGWPDLIGPQIRDPDARRLRASSVAAENCASASWNVLAGSGSLISARVASRPGIRQG
jgi:hypothetical protein